MLRVTLLLLTISSLAAKARDDAAISHDAQTVGCPVIPTSISFTPDYSACERFNITSACPVEYYHIDIYDRDHTRVYTSYDIAKNWDGSFNRSYLPVGCYIYEVMYRINTGSPLQIHRGTVVFLH